MFGFKGTFKYNSLKKAPVSSYFRLDELLKPQSRLSTYFNSDLCLCQDGKGEYAEKNKDALKAYGQKELDANVLVYNTKEFLIVGFMFCAHDPNLHEDSFWGLINPEQSKYVSLDKVEKFLKIL